MSVAQLTLIYVVIGAGWALVRIKQVGLSGAGVIDAGFLILIWPLYGPLMGPQPHAPANPLLSVLIEALPDAHAAQRMAQTITALDTRIDALNTLLARPEFDLEAVTRRTAELTRDGHDAAARAATRRHASLQQLSQTRAQCVAQRVALDELLVHLRTQVEVARYTGTADGAHRAVGELENLVGDLDALLDDDVLRLA
jgi:hypothetical protein